MLAKLRRYSLKLQLWKQEFHGKKVNYHGRIIIENGVKPDPGKKSEIISQCRQLRKEYRASCEWLL
jgi:hypothetical protein